MWGLTRGGKIGLGGGLVLALGLAAMPLGYAQVAPAPGPAAAEIPSSQAADAAAGQAALAEIEASISLSKDKIEALKRDIDDMKGDRTRQNAALIAGAERVKLAETAVAAIETKLGDLIVSELEVRGRLDGADANISNVLAALQRISRNPPPALIVDPSDALGSARGAMLISAILPQLRDRAGKVIADLKHLTDIMAAAQAEEVALKANFEILEEEQLRIATLIVARRQSETIIAGQLAEEEQAANALAEKATSLKQLIGELTARAKAVQTAAAATDAANSGARAPSLDKATIATALANTARLQPAVPFAAARGFLTLPSSGVKIIDYGASDGFGGISKGLSLVTRAQAQVVAPADGWVLYRGNYLNYGQIIILDAGQNYTILLAGLASIAVNIGEFVLMGEPLGTMGSRTIGQTVTTSAGASRPTLYIEMRKNNEPLDPTGWWADPDLNATSITQNG